MAAEEAVSTLAVWADADALTDLRITANDRNTKSVYALKVVLMGLVPSWALLADYASNDRARKDKIDAWLSRLVRLANVNTGGLDSRDLPRNCARNEGYPAAPLSNCNNHRYLRDAVAMAWGAYTGDEALFNQGLERYWIAMTQMADDGRFPLEAIRGSRALWYQRHALASLAVMAQMADVQGVDLTLHASDGKSIATALRYLTEKIANPETTHRDARFNAIPGPSLDWRRQDLGFLRQRSGRHYMAWTAFPGIARNPQVQALAPSLEQPMIDEYSGGNISCLAGPLPPPASRGASQSAKDRLRND